MKSTLPEIRVILTIDTEEDNWAPTRFKITVDNIRRLSDWAGFFDGLGLRPTYFTSYQVASVPWASDILRQVSQGGRGEIGAHLHPWNTPPMDESFLPHNWMLNNLPGDLQHAKLERLTGLLEERLGTRPRAFRAGRFGLGPSMVAALARAGYEVDSSVTPFLDWRAYDDGPSFKGAPIEIYRIAPDLDPRTPTADGPIVEVPLSVGYTRLSPVRWARLDRLMVQPGVRWLHLAGVAARLRLVNKTLLSPESESVPDMIALSRRLLDSGARHLHLFFHSSSLVPGLSPFARTARDVERIRARVSEYVERLARVAHPRFVTVSEAAADLAPPLLAPPAGVLRPAGPIRLVRQRPKRPKRLLVITYHFPPDGAVGGLRWAGLTKYLSELGWQSRVLTAVPGAVGGRDQVTVESSPTLLTANDVYVAIASRLRRALANRNSSGEGDGGKAARRRRHTLQGRLVGAIRLEGGALLSFPDEARGWILAAARRARRIINEFNPDVVVTSGPPHSAHVVGALATRRKPVRWLADLRDPWAGPWTDAWRDHGLQRSLLGRTAVVHLERFSLNRADGLLVNTRELRDALTGLYPALPIQWVPNGVDPERLPGITEPPYPGLSLAYLGTIYGSRDLGTVLRAFRTFLDRHPGALAAGSRLRMAGRVEGQRADSFSGQLEELGLQEAVEHLGLIPAPEALQLLGRSSLALVLAQGQELQIPAKLYESVGLRVPTLVITEPGSATYHEARRLGAYAVSGDDVAGIADLLASLWLNPVRPETVPEAIDYRNIAKVVDEILSV